MGYYVLGLRVGGSEVVSEVVAGASTGRNSGCRRMEKVAPPCSQGSCWCIHKRVVVVVGSSGRELAVNAVDLGVGGT